MPKPLLPADVEESATRFICLPNNSTKRMTELILANGMDHFPRHDEKWNESEWDLGYVITCYKSQGSEWLRVVIAPDRSGILGICDQHWIDTAISHVTKKCYLIVSNPQEYLKVDSQKEFSLYTLSA